MGSSKTKNKIYNRVTFNQLEDILAGMSGIEREVHDEFSIFKGEVESIGKIILFIYPQSQSLNGYIVAS